MDVSMTLRTWLLRLVISSSNEIFFNVHVAEILYVGIIIQRTETKRWIKCMPFVSNLSNAFFNVNSHTHTHTHTYTHTHTHTHTHACVCVYIYICVCIYIYMCVCVYIYIYMCVCVCIYIYIYTERERERERQREQKSACHVNFTICMIFQS